MRLKLPETWLFVQLLVQSNKDGGFPSQRVSNVDSATITISIITIETAVQIVTL